MVGSYHNQQTLDEDESDNALAYYRNCNSRQDMFYSTGLWRDVCLTYKKCRNVSVAEKKIKI